MIISDHSGFTFQSDMYCEYNNTKEFPTLSKALYACFNDMTCLAITDIECDNKELYICNVETKNSTKGTCSYRKGNFTNMFGGIQRETLVLRIS